MLQVCDYPVTIFLLDCCRTELPAPPSSQRHTHTYSGSEYPNLLVIHTTNKGNSASDCGVHGGYGPFMPRFCHKIVQPNMSIEVMLVCVGTPLLHMSPVPKSTFVLVHAHVMFNCTLKTSNLSVSTYATGCLQSVYARIISSTGV